VAVLVASFPPAATKDVEVVHADMAERAPLGKGEALETVFSPVDTSHTPMMAVALDDEVVVNPPIK
jgi:hypothetical protein